MSRLKKWQHISLVLLLVLAAAALPGCLKVMQQAIDDRGSTDLSPSPTVKNSLTPSPVSTRATIPPPLLRQAYGSGNIPSVPVTLTASPNLSSTDLVTSAQPDLPTDPYPDQHAIQVNTSPEPLHRVRIAEFRHTYVLRGNSTGLVVNATKLEGPLWIYFDVEPLYDCIENPGSCRGKPEKSISLPYFTITVRDNQTREIVAEDGYGRIYSSQKTNRTIQIYREGRYHLTLSGNSVDVTLAVATGAAPVLNETQQAAGSSPAKTLPPEILRRIRGGA